MNKEIDIEQIRALAFEIRSRADNDEDKDESGEECGYPKIRNLADEILALLPCQAEPAEKPIKDCYYCATCDTHHPNYHVCKIGPAEKPLCKTCKWFNKDCTRYPRDEWPGRWISNKCEGYEPAEKPESSTRVGKGVPARFIPEGESFVKRYKKAVLEVALNETDEKGDFKDEAKYEEALRILYEAIPLFHRLDTANAEIKKIKSQHWHNLVDGKIEQLTAKLKAKEGEIARLKGIEGAVRKLLDGSKMPTWDDFDEALKVTNA